MDLALNLGIPLREVKKLGEGEFTKWNLYAAKYMLPQRRVELYLAQIALWIARVNGVEDVRIEDFLFDPPAEPLTAEDAFQNDAELLGFAPTKD